MTDMWDLWYEALADAQIEPAVAKLFQLRGRTSENGELAKTWFPGSTIDDRADRDALGHFLDEANSDVGRAAHRVAVWIDRRPEGIAAVLRHELEHCLQFDVHGPALQLLHDRAFHMLVSHAGGRPDSISLYNRIPMETDTNAAAARFVRWKFGDARIDFLVQAGDEHAAFFRPQEAPGPIATLPDRMSEFIHVDGPRLARDFARGVDGPLM